MLAAPPRTCFYFGALLCPGPQVTFDVVSPRRAKVILSGLIVFFVTACVSTVRYLCVSMQTAFTLAPQRFHASVSICLHLIHLSNRPAAWTKIILHAAFSHTGREGRPTRNSRHSGLLQGRLLFLPTRKNTRARRSAATRHSENARRQQRSSEMGTERERDWTPRRGHRVRNCLLRTLR